MHLKITQNPLKNGALEGTWATLGPTCVPGSFPRWSFCTFGSTLGTPGDPLGPTWLHFGIPRLSFWSPLGTMWHHLGDFGQLVKIAILWWEYCDLDHFGGPWGVIFDQNFNKAPYVAPLPAFFAIFLQLFGQRELMRATLSHFLSKMGSQRSGGPSSQVTQFSPSSDSSLSESLRVLKLTHLQLLGKPELSGIWIHIGFGRRVSISPFLK